MRSKSVSEITVRSFKDLHGHYSPIHLFHNMPWNEICFKRPAIWERCPEITFIKPELCYKKECTRMSVTWSLLPCHCYVHCMDMLPPPFCYISTLKTKKLSAKMPGSFLPQHMLTASLGKVDRSLWPSQCVCCNNKVPLNSISICCSHVPNFCLRFFWMLFLWLSRVQHDTKIYPGSKYSGVQTLSSPNIWAVQKNT